MPRGQTLWRLPTSYVPISYLPFVVIGILQLDFSIPGAMSLKEKRHAIRSVRDRIAHRWNVSIAEVAAQDQWRRAVFGVAMVGSDHAYVEGALKKVVDFARAAPDVCLDDFRIDFV